MTSLGLLLAHLVGEEKSLPSVAVARWGGGQSGVNGKLPFGVVTNHEMLGKLTLLDPLRLI